jgi:uncharacterized repeat protein (TIGR03803 family)
MQNTSFRRGFHLSAIFCLAFGAAASAGGASAATFNTIHDFCAQQDCTDGDGPTAPLTRDSSGNLYGTAEAGGTQDKGVVFEMSPAGNNSWTYQVLYSFCAKANCTDGSFPVGSVVIDTAGNLYGTTYFGGASNNGTAFELVHKTGTHYALKVLYNFCAKPDCVDGKNPNSNFTYAGAQSGAPYDGTSPLYSTFFETGAYGFGFVFALEPPAPGKKKWGEKPIYEFCAGGGLCSDGGYPANVAMDANGDLLGTTFDGGANAGGTVFQLSPKGKKWTETLLHSFCAQPDCTDGGGAGGIVMDAEGDIYGVTASGGLPNCGGGGCGVAYKLTPDGKKYAYTQLYSFCSQPACADGYSPNGTLSLDASGNLYGATSQGGSDSDTKYGGGVLFELSGTNYQVLHTFCTGQCDDGANPDGGVIADPSGNLFGTTANYGDPDGGTIFEWSP